MFSTAGMTIAGIDKSALAHQQLTTSNVHLLASIQGLVHWFPVLMRVSRGDIATTEEQEMLDRLAAAHKKLTLSDDPKDAFEASLAFESRNKRARGEEPTGTERRR